ncbi:MAG: DUF393 domain-containing protein [candidate division Zixibacteria bacterium]|nr:DUF393 domain-containing protein [candidate division Zixibacteria bacterium]
MFKPAIIYDSNCRLCTSVVCFLSSQDIDGRFVYLWRESEQAEKLLDEIEYPKEQTDTIILITPKKYHTRSSAALNICRILGGVWEMLYIFMLIPRGLRDRIYRFIVINRYKLFGRKRSCELPPVFTRVGQD